MLVTVSQGRTNWRQRKVMDAGLEIGGTYSPGEELRALGIGGRMEICWGRASLAAQFYLYFPKEV